MTFTAKASSAADFDSWVQEVKHSPINLDVAEYGKLLHPSENDQAAYFANADLSLYTNMLKKYAGTHQHGTAGYQ
jgi:cytochrome o ubiquinol oxidase subunit 2